MSELQLQVRKQDNAGREPKWHPDGWRSWLVCAAAATSVMVVSGLTYSFALLLPVLMESFQASRQETGNKTRVLRNSSLRTDSQVGCRAREINRSKFILTPSVKIRNANNVPGIVPKRRS